MPVRIQESNRRSIRGVPKNADNFSFPQDLLDAQVALLEARAAYEGYARALPWAAVPMPGWEAEKQLHTTYRSSRPASPGYTEEQAAEVERLRSRLVEISATVTVHPFWESVDRENVVAARMALKRAHEPAVAEAG